MVFLCKKEGKSSYEYEREAYDIFEKGDLLTLEAGRMTLTDNLRYLTDPKAVILPGHIYRVGNEIPQGYYLFRYDEKYFRNSYEFPEIGMNVFLIYMKIMQTQDIIEKVDDVGACC